MKHTKNCDHRTKKIVIFGKGYVSQYLIQNLDKFNLDNFDIYCTSRGIKEPIKNGNVTIINFFDKNLSSIIKNSQVILSTVPPDEEDPVLARYDAELLSGKFEWIGYLSSTSVYGDHNGLWVNEETECKPTNEKAKIRLAVEQQWLNLYYNYKQPIHILRLSGIYGPDRNCLEDIRNGKDFTVVKENQFFSRIHVYDICQAIITSIKSPTPSEIYNISDDEPSQLHIVQQFGAEILKKPKLREIPIEEATISNQAKMFFQDNKKVSSKKIVQALNIHWKYPNYRVGLNSLLIELFS